MACPTCGCKDADTLQLQKALPSEFNDYLRNIMSQSRRTDIPNVAQQLSTIQKLNAMAPLVRAAYRQTDAPYSFWLGADV